MADYKRMYKKLFNAITDAIKSLQTAQAVAEEMYLAQDDPEVILLDKSDADE